MATSSCGVSKCPLRTGSLSFHLLPPGLVCCWHQTVDLSQIQHNGAGVTVQSADRGFDSQRRNLQLSRFSQVGKVGGFFLSSLLIDQGACLAEGGHARYLSVISSLVTVNDDKDGSTEGIRKRLKCNHKTLLICKKWGYRQWHTIILTNGLDVTVSINH